MTELIIIAAVCRNGAIGRGGDLLFHIPGDLPRFKELTMGWPIIMGRKTFESFPKGPLPGRRNIVVSRREGYSPAGAEVVGSVSEALKVVEGTERAFVIGGGEIYRRFMELATELDITEVDASPADADVFFPSLEGWTAECGPWQEGEPRYRFVRYRKNS